MFAHISAWWSQKRQPKSQRFCKEWNAFVDAFVDSTAAGGPAAPKLPQELPPLVLPAVRRLVAIGDVHGDLDKTRRSFRLAGATDENDRWVGGDLVVVQVGDQLDRGDQEVAVLYFLERLQREALRAGGALHILNGNHETMNVAGRFRYATQGGVGDFRRYSILQRIGESLKERCNCGSEAKGGSGTGESGKLRLDESALDGKAARQAALEPGGPVTRRFLAPHPIVLQIGKTVFVHGGVLPEHVEYGLQRINEETREWMEGQRPRMPRFLAGRSAIVWAREYSSEDERRCDCDALRKALEGIPGAERMVVGHTIQEQGINSACENQVYRIDVGMSEGCGDSDPEVLEILDDAVIRRLTEKAASQAAADAGGEAEGLLQGWTRSIWPPSWSFPTPPPEVA